VRAAAALLLALLVAAPLPARAQAAATAAAPVAALAPACPPRGQPVVRVRINDPDPQILRPLPAADLQLLARQPDAEAAEVPSHTHHLGLTVSRVEWRSEITVRSQGRSGGPVCAVPVELRLTLLHAEHVVRLARELPPGGCLAQEVLAHERRHVAVNRRTLQEAGTALGTAARRWAARAEARAVDVAAAAALLQDDLEAAVEPVLASLRAARDAGHAAIDTPAEYARLSRICPTDQRRLRGAFPAG
jgi:hypothetical protein